MMSLKSFLPQISKIWGVSAAALYERQRALVRIGVLEAIEGRGPGSGVPLTAGNLAGLIIALALTENLSDTDARVDTLCKAAPRPQSRCPLTGATTFRRALASILESCEKADQVESVSVDRGELAAFIGYANGSEKLFSTFRSARKGSAHPDAISTRAIVPPRPIRLTAELLASALSIDSPEIEE